MPETIKFYSTKDAYGCFSNFAACPFMLGDKLWPTSKHYFQAQKLEDVGYQEAIRAEKSPMIAARMGRSRSKKLRADWESVKDGVMLDAVRAKFDQHDDARATLLGTADALLVEHTWMMRPAMFKLQVRESHPASGAYETSLGTGPPASKRPRGSCPEPIDERAVK